MSPLDGDAMPQPKPKPKPRPKAKPRRTPEQAEASELWRREVGAQGFALISDAENVAHEFEAHHLIPQQTLRRRARDLELPEAELLWDARNGVLLSKRRHERHHAGIEPVRWEQLPPPRPYFARMFAIEYGLEPWLERHMPGFAP